MIAYYNEHDPFAAAWLRKLIADGHIADGVVDERSIEDVKPSELFGFTQCHFFAGIGGWSRALRLAGWPDDRPIWTGSCPCQPFSAAGKGGGTADERHLWPAFFHLIEQCKPGVVFGEQVEAAVKHGWLDLVQSDLEGIGYSFGAVGLPAAGVGAPHIRQRLWFVAESVDAGCRRSEAGKIEAGQRSFPSTDERREFPSGLEGSSDEPTGIVADSHGGQSGGRCGETSGTREEVRIRSCIDPDDGCESGIVAQPEPLGRRGRDNGDTAQCRCEVQTERRGATGKLAIPEREQLDRSGNAGRGRGEFANDGSVGDTETNRRKRRPIRTDGESQDGTEKTGFWDACDWLPCRDGKSRPVEPSIFPLAHGIPNRVGLLRGAGNAIVPELAQAFIESYLNGR